MSEIDELKQLESFIVGNNDLEELENMIAEFNMFEVMGAVRQELRHSDFLAFMLNPSGKHGLGDKFLKRFLMRVLKETKVQIDISAIHVDVLDLSGATVERESQHIDILVHDVKQGFVCVIENKIYSGEHSDQLNRYLQSVKQRFGDVDYFIPIFLSPDGTPPEDENSPYIPVSYSLVHKTLEAVREGNQASLGLSVNLMMEHYTTMLRRHIMTDSDIAELCRKIYAEHKDALDLIFQHMPDNREVTSQTFSSFVDDNPELHLSWKGLSGVTFYCVAWGKIPNLQIGESTLPALQFFIEIKTSARITMYIDSGEDANQQQRLLDLLINQPFAHKGARQSGKRITIYRKILIEDYNEYSQEDLKEEIAQEWKKFLEGDLVKINKVIIDAQFE